ncbi:hypothetical protein RB213_002400 [Colletotrichum asianum]
MTFSQSGQDTIIALLGHNQIRTNFVSSHRGHTKSSMIMLF